MRRQEYPAVTRPCRTDTADGIFEIVSQSDPPGLNLGELCQCGFYCNLRRIYDCTISSLIQMRAFGASRR